MSQKQIISLGAVAMVLVAVIGMSVASYASQGDDGTSKDHPMFNSHQWQEKKAEMQAKKEVVKAAIESGDYQTWLEAIGEDSKIAQTVSEDEFPFLLEAYSLMQEAKEKMEQARQIKEDLGFPAKEGRFKDGRRGFHSKMMDQDMGFDHQ